MRNIDFSSSFKKDLKKVTKYPEYNQKKFNEYASLLANGQPLPANTKDHPLAKHSPAEYKGFRDYHLAPDIVVIYELKEDSVVFHRIGKHNNLGLTESFENDAIYLYEEDDFSNDDWDALDDDTDGISENDLAFAKELEEFLLELASEDDDMDDVDEDDFVSEEELAFAKELGDFLTELASVDDDITEEFLTDKKANKHFYKHCIDHSSDKISKRSNVYYDFKDVSQYKQYEKSISNKLKSYYGGDISRHDKKNIILIDNLLDTDNINKAFRRLFEGDKYIIFSVMCNLRNSAGPISIIVHSFANDVTKNYTLGNTIDIMAAALKGTNTLYPVDANYFENKINNILSKYSSKPLKRFKINH